MRSEWVRAMLTRPSEPPDSFLRHANGPILGKDGSVRRLRALRRQRAVCGCRTLDAPLAFELPLVVLLPESAVLVANGGGMFFERFEVLVAGFALRARCLVDQGHGILFARVDHDRDPPGVAL